MLLLIWIKKRLKSKTYIFAGLLAILTALQAQMPLLKEYLAENYNLVMFCIIAGIAILREVTKKPLSEK